VSPCVVGSLLLGADEFVTEMVRSKIPQMRDKTFGECTAIGVIRREVLVGGVVYHRYRGFDVLMSTYLTPGALLPGTLRALFAYPFNDLGCKRVSAIIGKKNKKSRKLCEGLGFVLEGVMKRGLDGFEDAFLFGMLKENCRWLKEREDGWRRRTGTAAAA
jgi:RimJ/RimL family protein N-acetyltransferase